MGGKLPLCLVAGGRLNVAVMTAERRLKPWSLILASGLLVSCSASSDPHSQVMDKIERQVVLPAGAAQLSRYSRYYTKTHDGRIQAAFVMHPEGYRDDVRRFCAAKGASIFPCSRDGKSELAGAGERKWLADASDMPIPDGGGCSAITFQYEPRTGRYSRPECNGLY